MRTPLAALLLAAAACTSPTSPAAPTPPATTTTAATTTARPTMRPPDLPASMAALGDSMTQAFLVCAGLGDCPAASWSTGSDDDVVSHAHRIGELRGRRIAAQNVAVSGATVAGLDGQVARAIPLKPAYVTVLIGANDACRPSEDAMTPAAEFAERFDAALARLVAGLPKARVLVLSIPDLMRLWEVGHDRPRVREVWDRYGICRSMLGDAAATSREARERRARVRARVVAFNDAMARSCARHRACRWDGNAVYDYDFTLAEVSDRDYWHPSRQGQRMLSEVSWRAGFWG